MAEQQRPRDNSGAAQSLLAEVSSGVEDDKDVAPAILEDIKATFQLFDQDANGAIDPKEIRLQMRGLGFEADNTTIYTFINDLDSDGSQTLEFEEFHSLMKDHLRIHEPEYNSRESVAEIFDFMDNPDPDERNGRIDTSCLRWIATALGDDLSEEEIEAMVRGADQGGKGYVDAEDFYCLMVRGASRPEGRHLRRRGSAQIHRHGSGLLRRDSFGGSGGGGGGGEGGRRRESFGGESSRRRRSRFSSRGSSSSMDLGGLREAGSYTNLATGGETGLPSATSNEVAASPEAATGSSS